MDISGKTTVVTGGGSGIGEGICEAFGAAGAKVVVADRDGDAARSVADAIIEKGGTALSIPVDVTQAAQIAAMVSTTLDRHGRIDVLINNAGRRHIRPFLEHTETEWREMLDVNLTGPFLCCKAIVPHMQDAGTGRIVNVASVAGLVGRPNRAGYCASKGGLIAFTRALAADLAGSDITVNAINPGLIATPFNAAFADDAAIGPKWAQENLVGRWGTPADIAQAALYLASDASSYFTGECINLDGGSIAALVRDGELG